MCLLINILACLQLRARAFETVCLLINSERWMANITNAELFLYFAFEIFSSGCQSIDSVYNTNLNSLCLMICLSMKLSSICYTFTLFWNWKKDNNNNNKPVSFLKCEVLSGQKSTNKLAFKMKTSFKCAEIEFFPIIPRSLWSTIV